MSSLELSATNKSGGLTTLTLTGTSLELRSSASPARLPLRPRTGPFTQIPIRNVVSATFSANFVEVSYITRKSPKRRFSLNCISGSPSEKDVQRANEWCDAVMTAAYQGRSPSKKLKVLVNPHGGPVCSQLFTCLCILNVH